MKVEGFPIDVEIFPSEIENTLQKIACAFGARKSYYIFLILVPYEGDGFRLRDNFRL